MYETTQETFRQEISKNLIIFVRITFHHHPETKVKMFQSFFQQIGKYDDDENLQYLASKQIDTFYKSDGATEKVKVYKLSSAFNVNREIIRETFQESI